MDDWEMLKMRIRARHKEREADEHLLELLKQGIHASTATQRPAAKEPQPQTFEEMIAWLDDLRKKAIHRGE